MRAIQSALLSIVIVACVSPARATQWVADVNGMGDFASIKDAVAAAAPSDTIWVRPGTYDESVVFDLGKDGILLEGDGPVEDIIIHSDSMAVLVIGVDPAVRLENLTLTGSSRNGALLVVSSKVEIVGCVVRDNVGPGSCHGVGGGGQIRLDSDALVENCIFENNDSWESPGGLIVWQSRADIRHNVFRNNHTCYGGGLEMYHCQGHGLSIIEYNLFLNNRASIWGGGIFNVDSSPQIRRNTFVGNGAVGHPGIWVLGGSPRIHNNIIADSDEAIHCQSLSGYPESTPVIGNNICWNIHNTPLSNCASSTKLLLEDPMFCNAAADNFGLCADSPAVVDGVVHFGAFGIDCGACGVTPVQKTSWGELKNFYRKPPVSAEADSMSSH